MRSTPPKLSSSSGVAPIGSLHPLSLSSGRGPFDHCPLSWPQHTHTHTHTNTSPNMQVEEKAPELNYPCHMQLESKWLSFGVILIAQLAKNLPAMQETPVRLQFNCGCTRSSAESDTSNTPSGCSISFSCPSMGLRSPPGFWN